MFHRKPTWSNHELRDLGHEIGYQYPVRIMELSRAGFVFEKSFDENNRKTYYYTLISEPAFKSPASAPSAPPAVPPTDLFGYAA